MMKRICVALVDGYDDGHHLTHLRNYARILAELDCDVLEFLPDPEPVRRWFEEHHPQVLERVRFFPYRFPKVVSPVWRWKAIIEPFQIWRHLARTLRAATADTGLRPKLVFLNWLDSYIVGVSPLVAWLLPCIFPYRWSGVFFHPWHLRIPDGPTRHESVAAEAMLRSGGCVGTAVLDHWIVDALAVHTRGPVLAFPDETDTDLPPRDPGLVMQLREAAAGRRIILLPGVLAKRKGVMALLNTARLAEGRPWCFAFVGALDEGLRRTYSDAELQLIDDAIAGKQSNVWFHPARIENEKDFNAIVCASDVLFAAYALFAHSSGIVTKAGFFEKPVLVSPGYCMAQDVEAYRLGLVVDPHDPDAVLRGLGTVLDRAAWARQAGAPDYAGFRQQYGFDALKQSFREMLSL